MKVHVEVYASIAALENSDPPLADYIMDHNDPEQRRVLGMQCRNAFEAGQCVLTWPRP